MLNPGCFSSTAANGEYFCSYCSPSFYVLLTLFLLIYVLSYFRQFSFSRIHVVHLPWDISDPVFLRSTQDTELHALKRLCIWKANLH